MLASAVFLLKESWLNLRRQGLMALASISTTAISLIILGLFAAGAWQVYAVVKGAPRQFEIHAYLRPGAPRAEAEAVAAQLRKEPGVRTVLLVTKEQAWEEYRKQSAYRSLLDGFQENPLPDMLRVTAADPRQTLRVADGLRKLPEVDRVNEGREVLRKLLTLYNVARVAGLVLAVALGLATVAMISNAIRLTLYARRRDIRVMQLVGATDGFIRIPFIIEGLVEGAIGGVLAGVVIGSGLNYYTTRVIEDVPLVNQFHLALDIPLFCTTLVVGGAVLGALGSMFSLRKFLHTT